MKRKIVENILLHWLGISIEAYIIACLRLFDLFLYYFNLLQKECCCPRTSMNCVLCAYILLIYLLRIHNNGWLVAANKLGVFMNNKLSKDDWIPYEVFHSLSFVKCEEHLHKYQSTIQLIGKRELSGKINKCLTITYYSCATWDA